MSDNLQKYRGVFPAFYACYDDFGEVSPDRVRAFTQYLIDKGVKGLYVGGSSGECIYQNLNERKLVLENVMQIARGKITIIAHCGCPSTRDSVDLAKHAEKCGVDALSSIPPMYFVLPEHAIEAYWTAMIEATNLDFFIYNIPGTTQYSLSLDLFTRMIKNPKVKGVKNSSMLTQDIQKFKATATQMGRESIVFNGPDEQFISGLVIGADGGIGGTYAVMPELFLAAERFIKSGNLKNAFEVQNTINDIIFTSFKGKGSMYAKFKEVLKRKGVNIGGARLPLAPVVKEDEDVITALIKKIDDGIKKFD